MKKRILLFQGLLLATVAAFAQTAPSVTPFDDGIHHWNLLHAERHYRRYAATEYTGIADNLVAYQNEDGGWMKNIDWLAQLPADSVKAALDDLHRSSTIDNGNTFPQIVYLAHAYTLTRQHRYRESALRGLEYLLAHQHQNGGWRGWDVDAITFNDDVTTGVLRLFKAINEGDLRFTWIDDALRRRILLAYRKGIDMILQTQYVQDGVKTGWGQQHDHVTLLPTQARSYELPSLAGRETCEVLRLLMDIHHPSPEVVGAVKAAVAWLERVAIHGIRIERVAVPAHQVPNPEYPYDKVVVKDKKAPAVWSRFYELADNRPFMCNRNGVKVYRLQDVEPERRVGYDWYVDEPAAVLAAYPEWLRRVELESRYPGYEVEDNMPSFYLDARRQLTWPMAWGHSSEKDFSAWRVQARQKLLECISPAPPAPAAYAVEVLETERREGYEARKILFNLSGWSRVPAYLLVPDAEGPHPAVLLLHDHGAHFTIGKEKMVRPFHVPELTALDADDWCARCYDGQYVGDYLAAHGYVVLAVDALFWGERGRKEYARYDSQQALSANLLQMGLSWGGYIAWDDLRSAEFLASLPMVDKEKVGAMGFSMGAHRAWMTAAGTDAVKAAAAVCWMNTTDSLMTLTNNQNKGGSAYAMLVPGLRQWMDYPHVASIACPKPLLLVNGLRDKLFPVQGVKEAYAVMRQVWESQGVADRFETRLYNLPHFCSREIQEDILRFFDRQFQRPASEP